MAIIKDNKKSLITYKQEKALHTLACKSAIKANMSFSDFELKKLVEEIYFEQKNKLKLLTENELEILIVFF